MSNLLKGPSLAAMWWDSLKKFTKRHIPFAGDTIDPEKMEPESTKIQRVSKSLQIEQTKIHLYAKVQGCWKQTGNLLTVNKKKI
jgi:hypothetical protein